MERVKVYPLGGGMPQNKGRGLFANAFMQHFPLLPVEEEGRLNDPGLRENFIDRVFTLKRWREILAESGTRGGLVNFHEQHKYLLMSHSIPHYRALGRIVADMKGQKLGAVHKEYLAGLMEALRLRATVKKHVNVLQHAFGYLKTVLEPVEKREILASIEDFRLGLLPLIVPLTLLRYNIRCHEVEYLAGQLYFDPHPKELMLRNHS